MNFKFLIPTVIILFPICVRAQEDKLKKHKLSANLTEEYSTLPNNNKTKDGIFLVYEDPKKLLLRGIYKEGKKSGTWRFYDGSNHLTQVFDYSSKKLLYTNSDLGSYVTTKYYIAGDTTKGINPPVKVGGATFTFLLLQNTKMIPEAVLKLKKDINVTYTFEVSETGETENISVIYATEGTEEKRKVQMKNEELLDFVPAKLDGKAIKSKVSFTSTIYMDKLVIPGNNSVVTGS
jgi:hypothetical protein